MKRKKVIAIALAAIVGVALSISSSVFAAHPTIDCEDAFKQTGCIMGDQTCYFWLDDGDFCFYDFAIYW